MKVVLIRPPTVIASSELRPGASPPLGLAYVAASLVEAGHEVRVVDAVGEALDHYSDVKGVPGVRRHGLDDARIVQRIPSDTELVGIGCMFSTEWPVARQTALAVRESLPGIPIVAGGEHVSACPEYVMKDCPAIDFCVIGEGEAAIVDLARALCSNEATASAIEGVVPRGGSRRRDSAPSRLRDLSAIPPPAWQLFPLEQYIARAAMPGVDLGRSMPIMASRGCPYECTFCSNPQMWGRLWKPREPAEVLEEMKLYLDRYRVTNFDFYDLTAIVRRDWIIEMSNRIIDSELDVTWQLPSGTRSEALDEEVVDHLYRSGCRNIIYAPESGSNYMLKRIKKVVKKDRMAKSIRGAVKAGIKTKANFIVGFPDEKLRHVVQGYAFAMRLAVTGLHDVSFFPYSPYPGSALYDRLASEGKVELNDEHFYSLVTNPSSYSEWIPDWLAPLLAYLGMALFYTTSFLTRPHRFLLLLKAIWQMKPKTRLDATLIRLIRRRRSAKEARALEVSADSATPS